MNLKYEPSSEQVVAEAHELVLEWKEGVGDWASEGEGVTWELQVGPTTQWSMRGSLSLDS